MARLIGVDLPRDKRLEVALTYIYGIGRTRAQQTIAATGVSPDQGRRHRSGLPVRGQRTRTNARGRKGPKRTIAGKKKAVKK